MLSKSAHASCGCAVLLQVNNVTNDQLAQVLDTLVRAGGDYTSIDGVMVRPQSA